THRQGTRELALAQTAQAFFFSSRRRHTRSYGDWSSDVCSSDLSNPSQRNKAPAIMPNIGIQMRPRPCPRDACKRSVSQPPPIMRSEERRVGKECRPQGARECSNERRGSRNGKGTHDPRSTTSAS